MPPTEPTSDVAEIVGRPRRYTLVDHALTRSVAVFAVAAAVGPFIRDTRADALSRYERMSPEEVLSALRTEVGSESLIPLIGETFLLGLVLLAAVEGIAAAFRIWIIPRA